jgi:cell division protein FtsN
MNKQRGGTLLGLIMGALIGLGAALAVAVYITKVPMPFMNKTPPRAAENEAAEAQKNRDWDPNAGLANKPAAKAAPVDAPAVAPSADAIGELANAKLDAKAEAKADAASRPAATSPAAPIAVMPPVPPTPPALPPAVSADPFNYFVQAGAFRTPEDAEQQRAKLVLMGLLARVSEREQSGRVVYRVRLGPFDKKDDADKVKIKLDSGGIEAALVRVQK